MDILHALRKPNFQVKFLDQLIVQGLTIKEKGIVSLIGQKKLKRYQNSSRHNDRGLDDIECVLSQKNHKRRDELLQIL